MSAGRTSSIRPPLSTSWSSAYPTHPLLQNGESLAEYTSEDIRKLFSTNLYGFIYLSQLVVTQMLRQNTGGSVVSTTASLADHPLAGVTASVAMITKGGIES